MRPSIILSQGVSGVPVTVSVLLHLAVAGALLSTGSLMPIPMPPTQAEPSFTVVPVEIRRGPAAEPEHPVQQASEAAAPAHAPAELPPSEEVREPLRPEVLPAPDATSADATAAASLPAPPHPVRRPVRSSTPAATPRSARPGSSTSETPAPVRPPAQETVPSTSSRAPLLVVSDAAPAPAYIAPEPLAGASGNPPPVYPREARRRGWEGTSVLAVTVSAEGRCLSVSVRSSSGHAVLDRSAISAVRRWRFAPARRLGRPVEATAEVSIVFRLT